MITDYLFLGSLIIERLREQLPEIIDVGSAADLAALEEFANPADVSAYVIYQGDIIPIGERAQGGLGMRQMIMQNWIICLCVYSPNSSGLSEGTGNIAGELMTKIINSLTGWTPVKGITKPLTRSSTTLQASYDESGFAYYPLVFTGQFIFP